MQSTPKDRKQKQEPATGKESDSTTPDPDDGETTTSHP